MDDSKNIYTSLFILVAMITVRKIMESLTSDKDKMVLLFMSMVNIIALVVVLVIILHKAYKKMKVEQETQEEKYKEGIKVNSSMKVFKVICFLLFIVTAYLIRKYLKYHQSNLWNDIFTITALILSINDDAFANQLFEIYYKSYHGNKIDKFLKNLDKKDITG